MRAVAAVRPVFVDRIAGFVHHVVAVRARPAAADAPGVGPDVGGQIGVVVVDAGVDLADHDRAAAGAHLPRLQGTVIGPCKPGFPGAEFLVAVLGPDVLPRVVVAPLQREGRVVRQRRPLLQVVGLRVRDRGVPPQPSDDGELPGRGYTELHRGDEFLRAYAAVANRFDGRSQACGDAPARRALDRVLSRGRDARTKGEDHIARAVGVRARGRKGPCEGCAQRRRGTAAGGLGGGSRGSSEAGGAVRTGQRPRGRDRQREQRDPEHERRDRGAATQSRSPASLPHHDSFLRCAVLDADRLRNAHRRSADCTGSSLELQVPCCDLQAVR